METSEKYRFTLQWGSETPEKVQAGEFLKNLANRKSEFIVMAVCEYIKAHPDIAAPGQKIKIIVKSGLMRDQIEAMVKTLVKEQLADAVMTPKINDNPGNTDAVSQDEIDEMINNLDMFN